MEALDLSVTLGIIHRGTDVIKLRILNKLSKVPAYKLAAVIAADSGGVAAGANTVALFIGRRLLDIDIFGRTDIFEKYFPKLLKGAALEAYELKKEKDKSLQKPRPHSRRSHSFYQISGLLQKL